MKLLENIKPIYDVEPVGIVPKKDKTRRCKNCKLAKSVPDDNMFIECKVKKWRCDPKHTVVKLEPINGCCCHFKKREGKC